MNKNVEFIKNRIKDLYLTYQSLESFKNIDIYLENIYSTIKKNIPIIEEINFIFFDSEENKFYLKGKKLQYNIIDKNYIEFSQFILNEIKEENKNIIKKLTSNDKMIYKGILINDPNFIIIIPVIFDQNYIFGALICESKTNINIEDNDIIFLEIINSNLNLFIRHYNIYQNLENDFLNTLKTLVTAMEIKDHYTKGHSERVMNYSLSFAFYLNLDEKIIQKIKWAGLLHDIGKIGIPENILNKNTPLTKNEFLIMKKHVIFSYQILQPLKFLEEERQIILYHHEKWDGSGYPFGLKENEIPLESRIISMADSFDAMNTNRPYRKKTTYEYIREQFIINKGKQFDPNLCEEFINFMDKNLIPQTTN